MKPGSSFTCRSALGFVCGDPGQGGEAQPGGRGLLGQQDQKLLGTSKGSKDVSSSPPATSGDSTHHRSNELPDWVQPGTVRG